MRSSSSTAISLARVIDLGVPRSWQEAVAVVCAAGDAFESDPRALAPVDCFISTGGTLQLTGRRDDLNPAGLHRLLAALLDGVSAPPELAELAAPQSIAGPTTTRELMRGLSYFERPDRAADISALAVRALAADAESRVQSEFSRISGTPRAEASRDQKRSAPLILASLGRLAVIVVMALVVVGVGMWVFGDRGTAPQPTIAGIPTPEAVTPTAPPTGVRSLVSTAAGAITAATDAGLRAIGLAPPLVESTPAAPPPAPAPAPPRKRPLPNAPGNAAAGALDTPPPAPEGVDAVPPEVTEPSAPPPMEPMPFTPFTAADTEVEPPLLVYPQLRTTPESGPLRQDTVYFELLVNENGDVEQARLRGAEPRIQDRMMVSATKTWRFRPAMLDGRAVRYRVVIPIPRQ